MQFRFGEAGGCWFAESGDVSFFLDGVSSAAPQDQADAAERIAASMSTFRLRAANYLDQFVDRAKAGGSADGAWHLVEIHLRRGQDQPIQASPLFMLEGDDGGLWSVDLRDTGDDWWPIRFERRQG